MDAQIKQAVNYFLCTFCGNKCEEKITEIKDYFIKEGNSVPFSIHFCKECQIAHTEPYLSDEELSEYYPEDYEAYVKRQFFKQYLQSLKYRSDLKFIQKLGVQRGDNLFEVGAGRGEFLKEAKDAGFSVSGIEPGLSGIKLAFQEFGISLQKGFASNLNFEKHYSVVVVRHVLEHINDGRSTLEKIFKEGLKSGGFLFLKIPKLDSWEARYFKKWWGCYDVPRHRSHFTERGIVNLLEQIGFTEVRVYQECVPIDIIRSCFFNTKYGHSKNIYQRVFCKLPGFIQYPIAQCIALAFVGFGAGRMIVIAKKAS